MWRQSGENVGAAIEGTRQFKFKDLGGCQFPSCTLFSPYKLLIALLLGLELHIQIQPFTVWKQPVSSKHHETLLPKK